MGRIVISSLVLALLGNVANAQSPPIPGQIVTGLAPGMTYTFCMKNIQQAAQDIGDPEFRKRVLDNATAACIAAEGKRQ